MKTVQLLRGQANDVYRAISDENLLPTDFEWQTKQCHYDNEVVVSVLLHVPTQYCFVFDVFQKERICWCSPHAGFRDLSFAGKPPDWPATLEKVRAWLDAVAAEHFEPDLWSTNTDERALIAQHFKEAGNSPFSPAEQARISAAVHELKQFLVSTGEYSESQLQFIEHRLAHLEESSKRLGRKDWITLAMGTLTNIVVGVALAPEAAREFIRTRQLASWLDRSELSAHPLKRLTVTPNPSINTEATR